MDCTIDVTLDKVSTKTAVGRQGPFEVHQAVTAEVSQVRPVEGFIQKIKGHVIVVMGGHSQATAIDRNAFAGFDAGRHSGRSQLKLGPVITNAHPEHPANFFNETGKHQS